MSRVAWTESEELGPFPDRWRHESVGRFRVAGVVQPGNPGRDTQPGLSRQREHLPFIELYQAWLRPVPMPVAPFLLTLYSSLHPPHCRILDTYKKSRIDNFSRAFSSRSARRKRFVNISKCIFRIEEEEISFFHTAS